MREPASSLTAYAPGLIEGFLRSAERYPRRPALVVGGESFTYKTVRELAGKIAATITETDGGRNPLVGILAHRSLTAYAGVLGIHGSGRGYVPFNLKFPVERLAQMLQQSQCDLLIAGEEGLQVLEALLSIVDRRLTIVFPTLEEVSAVGNMLMPHRLISSKAVRQASSLLSPPAVSPHAVAYLLFTSGSTGAPKGVPISHRNVKAYVNYVADRYGVNEHDRLSQMFDLTFDLSVHDMFVCWERGACLYCVPESSVMAPTKFIKDHGITMWFSVPSVVGFMRKMGMLKPGAFPSLRVSLFCGEPLPLMYAKAWQEAAPQSVVDNLYGPTEATIAITHYRWDGSRSLADCVNGIVPIGQAFDGQEACIIDGERREVPDGACGELCLAGSQVAQGYWNNPVKTAEQFVRIPGRGDQMWYRTGDLVKRDAAGCLVYLGRMDHQVKIRGYRVELQEVDAVLRRATGSDQVASVAWPVRDGIADGIRAFIFGGASHDVGRVLDQCRRSLPDYMVPRQIYAMEQVPLTVNGKLDRLTLMKFLENQGA